MTYREALSLLDQATSKLGADRGSHMQIIEALKKLDVLVTDTEAKATIAADVAKQAEKPAA